MYEEMSGDETLVVFVSGAFSLLATIVWQYTLHRKAAFGAPAGLRLPLHLVPPICLVCLLLVLKTLAAVEVRTDFRYVALFLVAGIAWLAVATLCFSLLGLSFAHDAVENRNRAATYAICGAQIAVCTAYTFSNIGEGPSIWNTFFAALVSTVSLFVLWIVLEKIAHVAESITVERDVATGLRFAGFLIAAALILGRSVAGNWESVDATLRDLVKQGWPAIVLLIAAIAFEKTFAPSRSNPLPSKSSQGLVPAAAYITGAVIYLIILGTVK